MAVTQLSGVRSVGNRWAQRRDLAERQRITTYRHSGSTGMWLIILLGTITGHALGLTGSGGTINTEPKQVYGVDTPLARRRWRCPNKPKPPPQQKTQHKTKTHTRKTNARGC